MGLQPRPDKNGKQRLHAAFSSFIAGTTSKDTQCSDGADGGAGVSCATVPRVDVSVGAPTTSTGLSGASEKAREYGECLGKANYSSSVESSGLRIKRGWR